MNQLAVLTFLWNIRQSGSVCRSFIIFDTCMFKGWHVDVTWLGVLSSIKSLACCFFAFHSVSSLVAHLVCQSSSGSFQLIMMLLDAASSNTPPFQGTEKSVQRILCNILVRLLHALRQRCAWVATAESSCNEDVEHGRISSDSIECSNFALRAIELRCSCVFQNHKSVEITQVRRDH